MGGCSMLCNLTWTKHHASAFVTSDKMKTLFTICMRNGKPDPDTTEKDACVYCAAIPVYFMSQFAQRCATDSNTVLIVRFCEWQNALFCQNIPRALSDYVAIRHIEPALLFAFISTHSRFLFKKKIWKIDCVCAGVCLQQNPCFCTTHNIIPKKFHKSFQRVSRILGVVVVFFFVVAMYVPSLPRITSLTLNWFELNWEEKKKRNESIKHRKKAAHKPITFFVIKCSP